MKLGFKQQAVLEEFEKKKKMTVNQASFFYGGNRKNTLNTIRTLELQNKIKFIGNGLWQLI
jgi:hypothetical protein